MTVKEQLIAAKALIDKPEKWCQGEFHAGDKHCFAGAIFMVSGYNEPATDQVCNALAVAMGVVGRGDIYIWNDSHSHAEVMAAFDRAIAAQGD